MPGGHPKLTEDAPEPEADGMQSKLPGIHPVPPTPKCSVEPTDMEVDAEDKDNPEVVEAQKQVDEMRKLLEATTSNFRAVNDSAKRLRLSQQQHKKVEENLGQQADAAIREAAAATPVGNGNEGGQESNEDL